MSRWDVDPPDDDRFDVRPNATCTDCGVSYLKAERDPTTTCDECSDRRDAWAAVTELRMARAAIPVAGDPVPVVVDVALVPTVPVDSAAYLQWLDSLRANARYGSDALAHAWYITPPAYARQLLTVAPDLWTTLQATARRAA
jgi:hypothetical protein